MEFIVESRIGGDEFNGLSLGKQVFHGVDPECSQGFHRTFPGQFPIFVGNCGDACIHVSGQIRNADILIYMILQILPDGLCKNNSPDSPVLSIKRPKPLPLFRARPQKQLFVDGLYLVRRTDFPNLPF
jgi:hypothetical protein